MPIKLCNDELRAHRLYSITFYVHSSVSQVYEKVTDNISKLSSVNPEKVVEMLQAELNATESENGKDKQMLIDLNGALTAQDQQVEQLKGQSRALEQFRVEAIFRVFSMKGEVRVQLCFLLSQFFNQS